MIPSPPPADDAELHEYADGRLSAERVPIVEARLAADPTARAQVSNWRAQNAAILRLYDRGAEQSLPPRLQPDGLLRQHRRGLRRVAAAAAVAAVIGLGAGWLAHGLLQARTSALDRLAHFGADLHRMASRGDVPAPIERDERRLEAELAQALAHDVRIPDLEQVGLRLVGGRALPIAVGKTAAQLLYVDGSGARFTLYLVRPDPREAGEFRPLSDGEIAGLAWPYEEFHCLLIGDAPRGRLVAISQAVRAELDAGNSAEG